MSKRILLVALLLCCAACQKAPTPSASTTPATPAAASQTPGQPPAGATPGAPAVKPVPAQLPATIAKVNGEAVTKDEFERAIHSLEGRAGQPVPAERRSEIYRGVLDQLIAYKLLVQESKALKISVSDAEVDGRVTAIQGQFPDAAAFQKALGEQHVTLAQLKDDQRHQMLVDKVMESHVNSKVSVQPNDVNDFYAKNLDKMKEPENIRVAHILIMVAQGADAAAKAKAKAEAEAILKQVRSGANFAKLAKEKSQDKGSADNGGELPPFTHGQMVPAFDQAAFKLKPGQVSGLVESQFGFHVIKMLERRPERVVPLEEARQQITDMLKQQQVNDKGTAYVNQLKSKSKIEIYI